MYNINKEESEKANDMSLSMGVAHTSTIDSQIPALELLKVCVFKIFLIYNLDC